MLTFKRTRSSVAAGRGRRGACVPGGILQGHGRHFEGRKHEILKFARFWQIDVCIADIDILHPLTTP